MSEDYEIVEIGGEPLPAGAVGLRVCVRLSGCPSSRWSRALTARLGNELVGHAAVGHLRLNEIVRGDRIVLEGVEASEGPALAIALRQAIEATNKSSGSDGDSAPNMSQEEADAIAQVIAAKRT